MNYQDYIDLGFTRHDMNDDVEMRETGYGGFILSLTLREGLVIEVSTPALKPKLYISINKDENKFHEVDIPHGALIDLINKFK